MNIDDAGAAIDELIKDIQSKYEASPHSCPDCGCKLLHANTLCGDCETKRRKERERRDRAELTRMQLPNRYQWCRFNAPELAERVKDSAAIELVRSAVAARDERITLLGQAGLGKTVLACCALTQLSFDLSVDGVFASAIALASARARARLGSEPELVADAFHAGVLVLDDLGAERDVAQSAVPDVLHARHENMQITIVTTGHSIETIAAKYGDGVCRRIFEDATIITLQQPGVKGWRLRAVK